MAAIILNTHLSESSVNSIDTPWSITHISMRLIKRLIFQTHMRIIKITRNKKI